MAKKNGKVVKPASEPVAVEEFEVEVLDEELLPEEEPNPLFEAARKVLLAYIGGWALAWDELEDFVNKLVERGEVAEKDARKLLREMAEKRKRVGLESQLEEVLDRMNVPTKADIEALGEKIAILARKVEELKKAQA
jgi:polyhydroxyalkanoate synthesis regulator phasin